MKKINLSHGKVATVDDEDWEFLNKLKWHTHFAKSGLAYAASSGMKLMHRLILKPPKGMETDHIDGNGLNNCRYNLRLATHRQNMCNRKVQMHSSCYKGVFWNLEKKEWRAQIRAGGKQIFLGSYSNEWQAALEYRKAASNYHGEFARFF